MLVKIIFAFSLLVCAGAFYQTFRFRAERDSKVYEFEQIRALLIQAQRDRDAAKKQILELEFENQNLKEQKRLMAEDIKNQQLTLSSAASICAPASPQTSQTPAVSTSGSPISTPVSPPLPAPELPPQQVSNALSETTSNSSAPESDSKIRNIAARSASAPPPTDSSQKPQEPEKTEERRPYLITVFLPEGTSFSTQASNINQSGLTVNQSVRLESNKNECRFVLSHPEGHTIEFYGRLQSSGQVTFTRFPNQDKANLLKWKRSP
jgi:hypothetical protein